MADIYTLHYTKSVSSSILEILLSLISTLLHYIKSVFFFYITNSQTCIKRSLWDKEKVVF